MTMTCTDCGNSLQDQMSLPAEERKPCPKCGSPRHTIAVSASGGGVSGGAARAATRSHRQDVPTLLLQAVIELGSRTGEGRLIEAVAPAWIEIAKLIASDPSAMYRIPARRWEEMIAGWYESHGFDEVTLTPRSGDLGRDVIAVKRGVLSVRILDQVKAYKPGHLVTADEVRALAGVVSMDRAASKGVVTTTSDFAPKIETDGLLAPLIPTRLELVNGVELARRLGEATKKR
ncbi:MAG: hypothetical protein JWO38_8259 [Gemmataceae bacterium]|nr:hypothetical protein [Gemmataceae bacterium]